MTNAQGLLDAVYPHDYDRAAIAEDRMGKLDGQVVIVTGAGRGIGRGLATAIAAAGAKVALVARTAAQLESVADEIRDAGGEAIVIPTDVTDRAAVEAAVQATVDAFGPVTTLVNNAGSDRPWGPVAVADPDEWWRMQEVHVKGALLFMHAVIPIMEQAGRGRIINMASAAAVIIGKNTSAYCVAKATLLRLTEHVDVEIKDAGLAAFCVHPGTIVTDMMHESINDPDAKRWAPEVIGYLESMLDVDTSGEQARLERQIVALAAGDHDDASGRYIDLEKELL